VTSSSTIYDDFARIYDLQHRSFVDDAPMYVQLAREWAIHPNILEIGCGSGRLMVPLVGSGFRVVGVDMSQEMLRLADAHLRGNAHASAMRWALIQADARAMQLDEQFGMACIPLNTFLHNLTRDDQLNMLRSARRHLTPGAPFVIDLPPNDEMAFQPDDGQFQFEATLVDAQSNSEIHKFVASRVYWATQEQELTYRIEEEHAGKVSERFVSFRLRHVFKHEMELLLLQTGFAPPMWFGDYELGIYTEGSPRMIAVARAV
jgi:SAM-dependent methyltransferase